MVRSFHSKKAFPNLFGIASHPNSSIAQHRDGNSWNLRLRRDLYDWEIEDLLTMLKHLEDCTTDDHARDKLKWSYNNNGLDTVKATYAYMSSNKMMIDILPWKLVWKPNSLQTFHASLGRS